MSESPDSPDPSGPWAEPVVIDAVATPTAVVRHENVTMADLPAIFDAAFGVISHGLAEAGAAPSGAAFARYEGDPSAEFAIEVGFPLSSELAAPITVGDQEVQPSTLPAGDVAAVTHLGAYDELAEAWPRLIEWAVSEGWAPGQPFWEVYVTEPSPDSDPASLRTDLFLPVFQTP